jgi:hypothetical protein
MKRRILSLAVLPSLVFCAFSFAQNEVTAPFGTAAQEEVIQLEVTAADFARGRRARVRGRKLLTGCLLHHCPF